MAMGGAGVAAADSANAALINPALLATYASYKEASGNSRFVLPTITAHWSDANKDVADLHTENYDGKLSDTINAFNQQPLPKNAQAVADAASDLDSALNKIANDELIADAQAALVIGIPSLWQGGAFYVNTRVVGSGHIDVTDADRELLTAYEEGLTYVATGGSEGASHPELFTSGGQLRDLTDTITSSARARGVIVSEAGVSIADQVVLFERPVFWGLTPKIQNVSTFDYLEKVTEGGVSVHRESRYHMHVNVDGGLALDDARGVRYGVTLKNLLPTSMETDLNHSIGYYPQLRAGVAYHYQQVLFAADLDVLPNRALADEPDSQQLALGAEYGPRPWIRLRGGYVHNLQDIGTMGLLTAGMGLFGGGTQLDFAVGWSRDERGAALQLLFAF
jgi:hypothetical protein